MRGRSAISNLSCMTDIPWNESCATKKLRHKECRATPKSTWAQGLIVHSAICHQLDGVVVSAVVSVAPVATCCQHLPKMIHASPV